MAITLARIDDRVIHGQTVTRWAASKPCNAILVISDKVAADELRKKVLKAAAGTLKLGIYTVAQGPAALDKARASSKSFFVIADAPVEFANLHRAGGDFGDRLNVGNMSGTRDGAKALGRAVSLTAADVEAFDYLASQGVGIEFQMTPEDGVKTWAEYRAKYESA